MMGLIRRKTVWTLTRKGWGLLLTSLLTLFLFILLNIHPFLAPTAPISAEALVVEGWIPDYAVAEAMAEFEQGSYQILITTGVELPKGSYLSTYKNMAELTAATLLELGFDGNQLVVIPVIETVKVNRTLAAAKAVENWLKTTDLQVKRLNLYTFGPHARRSWIIFKKALTPSVQIGVIAVPPQDYEVDRWWLSSQGVRVVIGEVIAYLYTCFIRWTY